jgi:hypothetical protein
VLDSQGRSVPHNGTIALSDDPLIVTGASSLSVGNSAVLADTLLQYGRGGGWALQALNRSGYGACPRPTRRPAVSALGKHGQDACLRVSKTDSSIPMPRGKTGSGDRDDYHMPILRDREPGSDGQA